MIALGIIILIIVIILLFPVGVDAAYADSAFALKAKLGPFRLNIIPGKKSGEDKKKESAAKKPRKEKKKPSAKAESGKKKGKLKLKLEDVLSIVRIGLNALGRFRRSIRIDLLKFHFSSGGTDPYSTVMNYGYLNSALGALRPLLHRAFRMGKEDYASAVDFESDKLSFDARLVLSIRIGQILLIALCAAFAFLKWYLALRRKNKAAAKAAAAQNAENEKITENSSAEKGN